MNTVFFETKILDFGIPISELISELIPKSVCSSGRVVDLGTFLYFVVVLPNAARSRHGAGAATPARSASIASPGLFVVVVDLLFTFCKSC